MNRREHRRTELRVRLQELDASVRELRRRSRAEHHERYLALEKRLEELGLALERVETEDLGAEDPLMNEVHRGVAQAEEMRFSIQLDRIRSR